jgi:hypothetical protein
MSGGGLTNYVPLASVASLATSFRVHGGAAEVRAGAHQRAS